MSAVLSEEEAATYCGISRSYLRKARMDGALRNRTPGPPYLKIGRAVRYLRTDLDAWLLAHRIASSTDEATLHGGANPPRLRIVEER